MMSQRERFLAMARFETPDYVPIFGFPGAPGMSRGCMRKTHDQLVATGMPAEVGGRYVNWQAQDVESWYRYWGTTGPIGPGFAPAWGAPGFETKTRRDGDYEIVESESGAVTRQVLNNDATYSMPEFITYPVRDRASWELYRERLTPRIEMDAEEMERRCRQLDDRDMPLVISAGGTYGAVRGMMGTEAASYAMIDEPELVHDMIQWQQELTRRYVFPLIERLRPEIVASGEDLCCKHGMLLSPRHFETFCAPYYRELAACAKTSGATVVAVDTDGNAMQFTELAAACGVNAMYPYEVKAKNDLFALREKLPHFLFFGWLEKETVNEGNEAVIEPEIMGKVPALLASGGYFPNGDHGIQPLVTFPNLCRFMTLLHDVCRNPEGRFPRMDF